MAHRKSTRLNRRKWPCGTCGLQRNTPLPQMKAEELLFGTPTLDIVIRDILKRLDKFHFTQIYHILPTIKSLFLTITFHKKKQDKTFCF